MEVLRVEGLYKDFGGVQALSDVSLKIEDGEHLAVIGPNGAGKTTLFNLLNGQMKPTAGHIFYLGQDITNVPAHHRTHLGIGRSYQIASLFNELTVMENIVLAIQGTQPSRYQMLRPINSHKHIIIKAYDLLSSMDLWERRDEPVNCISYGEQRKLEIALSMASEPKLLLLDEPSCGLTTDETADLSTRICNLEKNIALICVAHDMDLVFGIATHIIVLHYGKIIIQGPPEQIKDDPAVKQIYMGAEEST